MDLFNIFQTAGNAMNSQNIRLNIIASNISNANTIASTADEAYKALNPVFKQSMDNINGTGFGGVSVQEIKESEREHPMRYEPDNPMANEEGYVFLSNVNAIEEMANMISASRSYQTNVEIINTSKTLMLETVRLGNQ